MRIQNKFASGFTLIELMVVVSLVITLLGFIIINLVRSQQNTALTSAEEILIVDLKQQQLKSMIGDTEGRGSQDYYGIHFDSNRYVLFHGQTYLEGDSSNAVINLDDNMQFNNPNYNIVFSKLSGEISTDMEIELKNNTNANVEKIHLNKLGTITQLESL